MRWIRLVKRTRITDLIGSSAILSVMFLRDELSIHQKLLCCTVGNSDTRSNAQILYKSMMVGEIF